MWLKTCIKQNFEPIQSLKTILICVRIHTPKYGRWTLKKFRMDPYLIIFLSMAIKFRPYILCMIYVWIMYESCMRSMVHTYPYMDHTYVWILGGSNTGLPMKFYMINVNSYCGTYFLFYYLSKLNLPLWPKQASNEPPSK